MAARIGIFYHSDPAGHVPSGIDTFIRGLLQYAPSDLEYTLYGATSDPIARPVGQEQSIILGDRLARYFPLIRIDPLAARNIVPQTIRYVRALSKICHTFAINRLDVLDFHRIEPAYLFRHDRRPKNITLHQDMSVVRNKSSDIKWRYAPWLYERMEGSLFATVDRVFSVRESAVGRYAAIYPHMAHKFSFIPTWVDTATFHPPANSENLKGVRAEFRRARGLPDAARILVFVGRLDRQKDPLLLLHAFQLLMMQRRDVYLVIVGDGVLRSKVDAMAKSEVLRNHVTLLGALNRHVIAEVLQAADLFVLSSAYEGMPIAVLEALATGVPVVSTDVGELRRVVRDGINGYLSPERSPQACSQAMFSALERLDSMQGTPCESSVLPYHPMNVLAQIHDNHRHQAGIANR